MKSRHHDAGYVTEHDPKHSRSHRRDKQEEENDSLDKRGDRKKSGPKSSHHRSNRPREAATNY